MKVVKRIGPLSAMRVIGILYALFGLVVGAIITAVALVFPLPGLKGGDMMPFPFELFFGAFAIVILPIFYGVMGMLAGGLSAVLCNLTAQYVGGITVEVEDHSAVNS